MKHYMGYFDGGGARFVGVVPSGERRPEPLLAQRDTVDYQGAPYYWGALKPGTMQLAFALCADALQDIERARQVHGALAIYFLKDLDARHEFRISDVVIHAIIEKYERETIDPAALERPMAALAGGAAP